MKNLELLKQWLGHQLDRLVMFFSLAKYYERKYYTHGIKWLITDKEGTCVKCKDCGNIANGILKVKKYGSIFNVPYCKSHLSEMYFKAHPDKDTLRFPCIVET